jgi:negative regulator of flagellin synthesis FlgM
MKIGQPSELPALVTQAKTSASPKADANATAANQATAAASSARSAGVSVTVSTAARALEKTERSEGAEVDAEKVSSVRSAIQQGTYVVNAEAIADKLLSNAQEMLRRTTN